MMKTTFELLLLFLSVMAFRFASSEATTGFDFPTLAGMNTHILRSILIEDTGADTYDLFAIPKRTRGLNSVDMDCVDNLGRAKCLFLKSNFACFTHPRRIKSLCGKTCGTCVPQKKHCHQSRYGCCFDGKTVALGPNQEGCSDSCEDRSSKRLCMVLRKSGSCLKKSKFMIRKCSRTCGYCRPCEDEVPLKCKYLDFYNICAQQKHDAMNYCRKTCGFCGVHDHCTGHSCPDGYKCKVDEKLKPQCVCNAHCSDADQMSGVVCGRNGVTYKNICDMKHATCGGKIHVSAKHYGKCDKFAALDRMNCSMKEVNPDRCQLLSRRGMCERKMARMAQHCPISCGFCKAAAERSSCFRSVHGCCLDGKTQCKGPRYTGCPKYPACEDRYRSLCGKFIASCGTVANENFMKTFCPKSCSYCNP